MCVFENTEGLTTKCHSLHGERMCMRASCFHVSDKTLNATFYHILFFRARKHKLLTFEGETLFQRRDDDVVITLLQPVAEIRDKMAKEAREQDEFTWGKCM